MLFSIISVLFFSTATPFSFFCLSRKAMFVLEVLVLCIKLYDEKKRGGFNVVSQQYLPFYGCCFPADFFFMLPFKKVSHKDVIFLKATM